MRAAKCCIGRGLAALRPETGLDLKYLLYVFRRFAEELDAKGTGTTFKAVSGKVVREFLIPIAPSSEQTRIADALDELFSDLDAGVAALERVRENLKLYRASVLKAAVEGALTAEWRQQHPHTEPASELLKRMLAERRRRWEEDQLAKFKTKDQEPPKNWKAKYKEPVAPDTTDFPPLPEGWCWVRIEQLLFGIEAGKSFTCEPRPASPSEWGVIKVSAMSWGTFNENENKAVPKGKGHNPHYEIQPSDLLLSRSNTVELVGASVLVERCRAKLLLSDKSMRLLYSPQLDRRWLRMTLASTHVRQQMSHTATGTSDSMRNISQDNVGNVRIVLPALAEQGAIVEAVEDQLSVIDHLEADLAAKLKSAQALRQAILRHAFTGRLVPQDANDEPAAELLKRIAAERESRG
ncbi:MAG: restriction endonuclease subunit S, partial [Acidimicrobiia bacterium]